MYVIKVSKFKIMEKLTKICKDCGRELPLEMFGKNILRYSPNYTENESIEQENKESLG